MKEKSFLPHQSSEDFRHVGVISAGFGDGDAQFGVAQWAQGADASAEDPDDEREPHAARMLQNPLWRDEDTWANDVTCPKQQNKQKTSHSELKTLIR